MNDYKKMSYDEVAEVMKAAKAELDRRDADEKEKRDAKLAVAMRKTIALAKKRRKVLKALHKELKVKLTLTYSVDFWFDESTGAPLSVEVSQVGMPRSEEIERAASRSPKVRVMLAALNSILVADEEVLRQLHPENPDELRNEYIYVVGDAEDD